MIPAIVPDLPPWSSVERRLRGVWQSGVLTNRGPLVDELEHRLADRCSESRAWAVTTNSGTSALELTLFAILQLHPEIRQITLPSFTFVATYQAALRAARLSPRRVGILVEDVSLSLLPAWEGKVYEEPTLQLSVRPLGVMTGEGYESGVQPNADRNVVSIVIDAAGVPPGEISPRRGVHVVHSLHATKPLPAGEGGVLLTQDRDLEQAVRKLTFFGRSSDSKVSCELGGETNAKMSELHAATALAGLPTLGARMSKLRSLSENYRAALQKMSPLSGQEIDLLSGCYLATFPVMVKTALEAEKLRCDLKSAGIESPRWYNPPVHRLVGRSDGDFFVTWMVTDRVVYLPLNRFICSDKIKFISSVVESSLTGR